MLSSNKILSEVAKQIPYKIMTEYWVYTVQCWKLNKRFYVGGSRANMPRCIKQQMLCIRGPL